MPIPGFARLLLPVSDPVAVGEAGLDTNGHLQVHNGQIVDVYLPSAPIVPTLTGASTVTETIVASFTLPANYLRTGSLLAVQFLGQVSSTATLTYKIRCGTAGLITDTLLATFTTSAAGVANIHTSLDAIVHCLAAGAAGSAYAGGQALFGAAVLPPVAATPISATVNTTVANKLSVTATLGAASNTLASRTGMLERIA